MYALKTTESRRQYTCQFKMFLDYQKPQIGYFLNMHYWIIFVHIGSFIMNTSKALSSRTIKRVTLQYENGSKIQTDPKELAIKDK
jgi:hypothetical protein